jgi:hypothetical protein
MLYLKIAGYWDVMPCSFVDRYHDLQEPDVSIVRVEEMRVWLPCSKLCNHIPEDQKHRYAMRNLSLSWFCTMNCNIIIQYKPTKCTFSKLIF